MEEKLLREIASEYLVPLFSGAWLEEETDRSPSGAAKVTFASSTSIRFKVNRKDRYKLTLSRHQPFVFAKAAMVSEIAVVRAFVDVLSRMEEALASPLRQDLLSTFQRRLVARAIATESRESVLLSGIDQLARWANRLYEGAPISSAIGFRFMDATNDGLALADFGANDFGAVLTNGHDTILEFTYAGAFIGHRSLTQEKRLPSYCPLRQAPIAEWTTGHEARVALALNRLGEILVFRHHELLFARRSGRWHFLTHRPVLTQMGTSYDLKLKKAVYETCLDASFARTGACIGIISRSNSSKWTNVAVEKEDYLEAGESSKARAIGQIVDGRKFQSLDRRLRSELVALDGATIISSEGDIHAIGTILKIPGGSTGGGRLAAAQALSKYGLGVKVSQDGGISGFRMGRKEPAFRVM